MTRPAASGGRSPRAERPRRSEACEWHRPFLEALRNSGNVRASCRAAGITRQTAYEHKRVEPRFDAAWQEALSEAIDVLEAAARQRALQSSDSLLIFLLKAHRPEVYGDRMRIDVRVAAERLAKANGLDPEELVATAENIVRDSAAGAAARMEWPADGDR